MLQKLKKNYFTLIITFLTEKFLNHHIVLWHDLETQQNASKIRIRLWQSKHKTYKMPLCHKIQLIELHVQAWYSKNIKEVWSIITKMVLFHCWDTSKFCSIGITIGRKIQSYFRKMTNLDKKITKNANNWNSWPKNAKYSNTVRTTLFFMYATSKKKTNFKRSSLFSNVLPKLQKRKQSVVLVSLAKIKTKFSKNF